MFFVFIIIRNGEYGSLCAREQDLCIQAVKLVLKDSAVNMAYELTLSRKDAKTQSYFSPRPGVSAVILSVTFITLRTY